MNKFEYIIEVSSRFDFKKHETHSEQTKTKKTYFYPHTIKGYRDANNNYFSLLKDKTTEVITFSLCEFEFDGKGVSGRDTISKSTIAGNSERLVRQL